jgi:hypothetical protein
LATPTHDIGSYLKKAGDRSHLPFFIIFSDWNGEDWENATRRVQDALTDAGISLEGPLPYMMIRKTVVAPDNIGVRKRVAAEALLFDRYNQDGLFSLPHQKDPSIPRPSWFRDSMLVSSPHSIGQKLIAVCCTRYHAQKNLNKRKAAAERGEETEQQAVRRRNKSKAATENAPSAQVTPDRTAEDNVPPGEESLPSVDGEFGATQAIPKSGELKDLEIHIGTIFELDTGLLKLRRTYRDPSSWIDDSAPERFNFDKVCRSLGITGGWEKELYFFPDVAKDPHNVLDGDELRGAVQCLRKQRSKSGAEGSLSFFVAADVAHVQALPVNMRRKHQNQSDPHLVPTNDGFSKSSPNKSRKSSRSNSSFLLLVPYHVLAKLRLNANETVWSSG